MKKIISIIMTIIFLTSTSVAFAKDNKEQNDKNSIQMKRHEEFRKIFPEEFEIIERYAEERAQEGETNDNLPLSKEDEVIIDVEKTIGYDYYHLIAFSSGVVYECAVKGGTYYYGTNYYERDDAIAYAQMYPDLMNIAIGHTMEIEISYTVRLNNNDYFTENELGSQEFTQNQYIEEESFYETSSKDAFLKWRYDGRVGDYNGNFIYNPFRMTVTLGDDAVSVDVKLM
ncbi:hypothetical protein OXPF_04020 [Oxobacter pfennigii]|uniref:Deacetylase PdaC domain-containing protein n=1 Tax=Oxobacter pfennigii TaxID=36849 RepID=A0A0P8Z1D8_9CLOT|nr:hypothetical protein [Oxobacter pfennigii]KPU45934.1 hypothetical protein OXPF_04020 [Oxobacter pfennigii]